MKYVHTNIVAQDWKKLATFYIDVFDCKEKPPQRDLAGAWLDAATGLKEAALKGIHLFLPGYGDDGPTLEIFSYETMEERGIGHANTYGFSHIAFLVDDVQAIFEKALVHGGQPLGRVTRKTIEGVGDLTLVYFRDPEGNIVEIQSWD
jgi:catechol 2,3-dioxygenase-like lactoylglutathione lyase family enzyme